MIFKSLASIGSSSSSFVNSSSSTNQKVSINSNLNQFVGGSNQSAWSTSSNKYGPAFFDIFGLYN